MSLKLVMLPGMDGTGDLFAPFLKTLPHAFEPEVIPLPASASMSYREHADYIRDQLPEEEPFLLLAESFSTPIACYIADDPPRNLLGLVLVSGFWHPPRPTLGRLITEFPVRFLLRLGARRRIARHYLIGKEIGPRRLTQLQKVLKSLDPKVIDHRLRLASAPPPFTPTIHLPCLQVIARDDKLMSSTRQTAFDNIFPRLMSFKLHGPHLLLQAKPEFASRLLEAEVERMGLDLD